MNETARLIFKYRKSIYRMTKIKFEVFSVNGQWYHIENWEAEND